MSSTGVKSCSARPARLFAGSRRPPSRVDCRAGRIAGAPTVTRKASPRIVRSPNFRPGIWFDYSALTGNRFTYVCSCRQFTNSCFTRQTPKFSRPRVICRPGTFLKHRPLIPDHCKGNIAPAKSLLGKRLPHRLSPGRIGNNISSRTRQIIQYTWRQYPRPARSATPIIPDRVAQSVHAAILPGSPSA